MFNTTTDNYSWFSHPIVLRGRVLLYAVTPSESSFKTIEQIPNYTTNSIPYFVVLITLETLINAIKGHKDRLPRWDDAYSSLAAGVLSLLPLVFIRNFELLVYIWFHNNFAIYTLDWDCPWTWALAMIGVDFGYYWAHRCSHELNFMWAAHQAHHSSEDYNLTTALRQSVILRFNTWIFYLPLALFIPPQQYLVHHQFNLLYQFWIHTQVIKSVGPLEWILNTPSHHRVHHGRNRYCIDKNYGGTLIIWDRIFGTFVAEKDTEDIAYGLVHPLDSWDPIYTQLFHWKYILQKMYTIQGVKNKLSVLFKGPGWDPGKPRLGEINDIPDIHGPTEKYSRQLQLWLNLYLLTHFTLSFVGNIVMQQQQQKGGCSLLSVAVVLFVVWTTVNVGSFYEQKPHVVLSELIRCSVYLMVDMYMCAGNTCSFTVAVIRGFYTLSLAVMIVLCSKQFADHKQDE